ncbi:hypothetical protein F4804DRAFT_189901 [Jackrogersella minutella]|nr:hypothetical protein F4804DRAFT_189901 [Jackrogersella minutella]
MSSISSRRSACDRCKGQKLRCLREPGQERCSRCTRANTECFTTPTLRFRNVLRHDAVSGSRKRSRQDDQPQSDLTGGTDQVTSILPDTYGFANNDSAQSRRTFSSEVTESWDPSFYGLMSSDALDGNFSFFDPVTTNIINKPMNDEQGTADLPTSQSNPALEDTLCLQGRDNSWNSCVSIFPNGVIATQDQDTQVGNNIPGDVHIERLSRINLHLATLLSHIGQGSPKVTLKTLISPFNDYSLTPIHNITDKTREYIDILRALSGATHQSETPSSSSDEPTPRSQEPEPCGNASSSGPEGESCLDLPVGSLTLASSSMIFTPDNGPAASLDAATLLLILTSYITVTRLFLIAFAHTHNCLKEISKSDAPSLSALPGLDFASLPLRSGNLQATVFIDIVNNLFERMESLLGVPREFRIGRRVTNHGGLLSEEEITGALNMMLSKEELVYQPENGKGGVKALRLYVEKTKELLRDKITP